MNEDIRRAMYAQDAEPEEKRAQPEQLRLAGKATVVTIGDKQIAIPRIDYVELLETRLREAEKLIEEQRAIIKKMSFRLDRNANIAQRATKAVESSLRDEMNQRPDWMK